VRIVSLNAWGGALFDALAEWLLATDADVFCIQEVTRTPALDGWTRFDDGERALPQRANLFDDLRKLLPAHQGSFLTSDAGSVLDTAGRIHRQDFGLATFVHERVAVTAQESRFVHGSYIEHLEWAIADRPRIAHALRTVDRSAGRTIAIAQMHGLRDPAGKQDTPERLAQANRLAELVSRTRAPDDLCVVCGDFNVLPESETFAILGKIGLVDLVGRRDTRTSHYRKPVRHAGYLLVSEPEAVQAFDVPAQPEVSDHRPLVLDL
jgi:endonuclease/exonuclease/phosphatase family metal-dependent hydrolase